jgi:Gnt-I system low-affinity gluconate transporter
MGETLGFVAVVVGLGAMLGQMLEISGGVERLAQELLKKFGESKAQWALALTGFIVAIPIFFDVGFIIIVPLVHGLARKTGRSLLYYGIPLVAGLAVTHAFVPPTPGPIAVAELLHADLGWVILFGIIAGVPATVIAGPLFARYIAKRIHANVPDYFLLDKQPLADRELPGFGLVVGIIFIPLALIILNTVSGAWLDAGTTRSFLAFIGHPFVALIIATLLAFFLLGTRRGYSAGEVQKIATKALEPAGIIILVTGAGGVFKQVLVDSEVGKILGEILAASSLPPIVLAFLAAAIIRIAQGSATVAMITAAGIISPMVKALNMQGAILGLMVIAIAAGASIMSHVNDSGFWLISRYFGLSEKDTLRSWTVSVTLVALAGFLVVFVLALFVN